MALLSYRDTPDLFRSVDLSGGPTPEEDEWKPPEEFIRPRRRLVISFVPVRVSTPNKDLVSRREEALRQTPVRLL